MPTDMNLTELLELIRDEAKAGGNHFAVFVKDKDETKIINVIKKSKSYSICKKEDWKQLNKRR